MALSGTFYGTTSNSRIKPQITWSAVQSVAGNYSDVTATLAYTRSNSGYTTGGTWEGTLTINGVTASNTLYMEITYGNVTEVLTSTVRVYHDENGAKTITVSATGGITKPSSASLKTTAISLTFPLDTIARAATVSATDCNIGACSTVVISKSDVNLTTSLCYQFGSLSGYIAPDGIVSATEQRFNEPVVNFAVPTDFYGQIPAAAQGVCTLTCTTYSGETCIGSATTTFTATAAEIHCAPELTVTAAADICPETLALTGNDQVLVLGASTLSCGIAATAKNSAYIVEKTVAGQALSGDWVTLEKVDDRELSVWVKDSRGYTAHQSLLMEQVPYVALTANVTPRRITPTGDMALVMVSGMCFGGCFGLCDNTLSLTLEVVETGEVQTLNPILNSDNTYWAEFFLEGLAYDRGFALKLTAADRLSRVEKTLSLSRGLPVFDWGPEDFRFNVPVYVPKLYVNGREI
ncbi:MAG: hypothetical protein IKJ94_05030 [Oscillospiraceae bacterium]|nr:hypothetical protein [Oscillospiraceae bacterium]